MYCTLSYIHSHSNVVGVSKTNDVSSWHTVSPYRFSHECSVKAQKKKMK